MGEHGKRAAPKAAAPRGGGPPKASAPHGRNRTAKVERDRPRRWGPLTAETAIVLGVAAAIVAGAFMMEELQPAAQRTNTTVGKDTVEVHNLGKGGIKPGPVQPRVIPRETIRPVAPTLAPTATAKPGKTAKPVVTAEPTTDPGDGGVIPDPGTGGGGTTCTPIPLIRTCPDPEPEETPEPTTEPEPEPSTAPTGQAGTQGAASTSSKTDSEKAAAAKKKKPTPTPTGEPESASR